MKENWKDLEDAEDHAYFMAELVDMSPESFTLEEKKAILDDMIESSTAIEDAMREGFARLGEVTQTRLLDSLGQSGYRDRDWCTVCSWMAPSIATVQHSSCRAMLSPASLPQRGSLIFWRQRAAGIGWPGGLSLLPVGLPHHVLDDDVVYLPEARAVLQDIPGDVRVEMDFNQLATADDEEAVAADAGFNPVFDDRAVKLVPVDEKLGVVAIIFFGCHCLLLCTLA